MAIRILVKACKAGYGKVKPFGTYSKAEHGAKVFIGKKQYNVDKNGYVTIPKKVMNSTGNKDKSGRQNVVVQFSAKPGVDGWKETSAIIIKPLAKSMTLKNGARIGNIGIGKAKRKKNNEYTNRLIPADFVEQNYSP